MKKSILAGIVGLGIGVGLDRVLMWASKKFRTKKEEVVYHIVDDTPPKPPVEEKKEEPKKEPEKSDDEEDHRQERRGRVEGFRPIIVSEDEYRLRYSGYNETKIIYYKDSGIFVNSDNDIPLERPQLVLGEDAVWRMEQDEDRVLYVHDESMMMNYVIEATDETYDELNDLGPDDDE